MTVTRTRPAGVAKPRAGKKARVVLFTPIPTNPGAKEMLNAEHQAEFHALFQSLNAVEQAAVTQVLNWMDAKTYRSFFRFWRSYKGLHPADNVDL